MLTELAYSQFFGFSLVFLTGLIAFILFIATATIAILTVKGIKQFPISWHSKLAIATTVFVLFHVLLVTAGFTGL